VEKLDELLITVLGKTDKLEHLKVLSLIQDMQVVFSRSLTELDEIIMKTQMVQRLLNMESMLQRQKEENLTGYLQILLHEKV
jgi:hypothetical protein